MSLEWLVDVIGLAVLILVTYMWGHRYGYKAGWMDRRNLDRKYARTKGE